MIRIADDADFFEDDERSDLNDADSFLYSDMGNDWSVAVHVEPARCYDPARGVWLSTDPLGYGQANFHVYPANNPTLPNDPDGLCGNKRPQLPLGQKRG